MDNKFTCDVCGKIFRYMGAGEVGWQTARDSRRDALEDAGACCATPFDKVAVALENQPRDAGEQVCGQTRPE